jgi:hypothetical protein
LVKDTYSGDTSDPLSLNLYTYCHNEPIMYYDPDGHSWKYMGLDNLINWAAGTHIGEDSTERTLMPEAAEGAIYLDYTKKYAEKTGNERLAQASENKIKDLYKYGSAEIIIETPLQMAPLAAVPAAVAIGILAAPAVIAATPEIIMGMSTAATTIVAKVASNPVGNYLLNNGDKIVNRVSTATGVVQTGKDIATGNYKDALLDGLGTAESFLYGKQFNSAKGSKFNAGASGVQKLLPAPKYSNPWVEGGDMISIRAPKDFHINMAMSKGQVRPGGWGTLDDIPNVNYVRNELAVTPEFKPNVSNVQKFLVPEGTQIQIGKVGPQIYNGKIYNGGGNQVEILNYSDRSKLVPNGEPKNIK